LRISGAGARLRDASTERFQTLAVFEFSRQLNSVPFHQTKGYFKRGGQISSFSFFILSRPEFEGLPSLKRLRLSRAPFYRFASRK